MCNDKPVAWQAAISECELSARTWLILESRFGTGKRQSLRDLGDVLGMSGERVRQLQSQGIGALQQQVSKLRRSLSVVEDAFAGNEKETSKVRLHTRSEFITTVREASTT